MNEQLSLFRESEPSRDNRSLFLAIIPEPATAEMIHELATSLHAAHRMRGRVRRKSHLHISLHGLGRWSDTLIRSAEKACSSTAVKTTPFEVTLDRAMYWPSSRALVLSSENHRNASLRKCRELLGLELAKEIGLRHLTSGFTPHVTMHYCDADLAPQSVAPVSWIVREITLVCSHVGRTEYQWLGRWPLLGD